MTTPKMMASVIVEKGKTMTNYRDNLDKRICDVEEGATNTETYREFIVNSIHHFYGNKAIIPDLDNIPEEGLEQLIDELDEFWWK